MSNIAVLLTARLPMSLRYVRYKHLLINGNYGSFREDHIHMIDSAPEALHAVIAAVDQRQGAL
jgi:hypothetical protein